MSIKYSDSYNDGEYYYQNLEIPDSLERKLPAKEKLSRQEWRKYGISFDKDWEHYGTYRKKHILFRRPIDKNVDLSIPIEQVSISE